jgi:hypothetical protein
MINQLIENVPVNNKKIYYLQVTRANNLLLTEMQGYPGGPDGSPLKPGAVETSSELIAADSLESLNEIIRERFKAPIVSAEIKGVFKVNELVSLMEANGFINNLQKEEKAVQYEGTKDQFVYNLKLAGDRFVKDKNHKKYLDKIVNNLLKK